jgi:hypothetical protein
MLSASGTCMLVDSKIFNKVNGFDEQLKNSEDIDLIRRIMKLGFKFHVIPYQVLTSVRRFEKGGAKGLALTTVAALTVPVIIQLRWKFLNKYRVKLEKMYGETGGGDVVTKSRKGNP